MKKFKKQICLLLACILAGSTCTMVQAGEEAFDTIAPEQLISSENHLKYELLLAGGYSDSELLSKFHEFFGTQYSDEEIRTHYAEIFDLEAGEEIDQALLDVITNYREDFSLQDHSHVTMALDSDSDILLEEVPPFPELAEDTEPLVVVPLDPMEKPEDSMESPPTPYTVAPDMPSINLMANASSANSFTSVSVKTKANTSVTLNLWFKSGDTTNNYLKMYDKGKQVWTTLLGQGKPTTATRSYTVTGLLPGNVYIFCTGKYDWNTKSWQKAEITVQTTGAKQPSLQLVSKTPTSITVKAQFPTEGIWGNRLRYYNKTTKTWDTISGKDLFQNSGAFTIKNLLPTAKYTIALESYDHLNGKWRDDIILKIQTQIPPENLISYTKSNVSFKLDKIFIDALGPNLTNAFLTNTNQGYTSMYNLVNGSKTYHGGRMQINHVRTLNSTYEGLSGYPISWRLYSTTMNYNYAIDHAEAMKRLNVSTTETPFHEISHNFDNYKWKFEAEALAILKIYYHFSTTGQSMVVASDDNIVTGRAYKTYMKSYANRIQGHINYDAAMAKNVYSPYSLAYNLGSIADRIGWDKFTKTFSYFYDLPASEVPATKLGKFNLFLTKLSDYSGQNVFSMFTAKEKQVYESYFGGKLERDLRYTPEETYQIAQKYITDSYGSGYTIERERIPLVDEHGILFAYAVPYQGKTGYRAGHINVGALKNGISFYLIDPIVKNYSNIEKYSDLGWDIMYLTPFAYYYCQVSKLKSANTLDTEKSFTEDEFYFNEENYQNNLKLLEELGLGSDSGRSTLSLAAPTVAALKSELADQSYVKVNTHPTIAYGGDQYWWKDLTSKNYVSRTGKDKEWLYLHGCGCVAFTNVILYNVGKNYSANKDLLKYTDTKRELVPMYNYTVFNKTASYFPSNKEITALTYVELLDFYADMTRTPQEWGVSPQEMETAFLDLFTYTQYSYKKHTSANNQASTVETFLINQLNNDTPVLFLNLLESYSVDTKYLLNDKTQADNLGITSTQSFDNHWMTITKYFKDNNTGESFVAFSTWGCRVSINTKLLRRNSGAGNYYSSFYAYEVFRKAGE